LQKRYRKLVQANGRLLAVSGVVFLIIAYSGTHAAYRELMASRKINVNYSQLLDTIAKGESRGNYNAYFGNASNTSLQFTAMTVTQVLQWQKDYVEQGNASSAVGKYQILRPTLIKLVRQLKLTGNEKFDARLQDSLAVALLEKRGSQDYLRKDITREEFAANLAKEWAALPKIVGSDPEQSYYAGDGINKVQITIEEMYTALASLKT